MGIEKPRGKLMTSVNLDEYKEIEAYCRKHNISIYKLIKDSVLEKVRADKKGRR